MTNQYGKPICKVSLFVNRFVTAIPNIANESKKEEILMSFVNLIRNKIPKAMIQLKVTAVSECSMFKIRSVADAVMKRIIPKKGKLKFNSILARS